MMGTALRPYPRMKDSGLEWLGDVPEHWEVRSLGMIGRFFKGRGGTKADETEEGVPCVRYGDLYTRHQFHITQSKARVAADRAGTYTPVRYGDVLFAGSGETLEEIGKSAVNLMRGSAVCGGDVIIFRPTIDVDAEFIGWSTDCRHASSQKAHMGRGITVMHIYSSDLKYLAVSLPPLPEQTAIARFLDHADQRIRRCIRAKERLIELLEEQKQAIIHQAVTGRIDVRTGQPYPAYKDSGVEWLGKVPEHWELMSLKWLSRRIQNGATPPTARPRYYENGTVPWYGPSSCGTTEEVGRPVKHLNPAAFSHGVARIVMGPAILFVVIGATAGRMALMRNEGSTNQQITAYEADTNLVCPRFLLRQLRLAENWLRSTASSATLPILDSNVVDLLKCAIPSLAEQDLIGQFLRSHMEIVDRSLADASRQIALLNEYRTRLIADVVTGKLDVREAAYNLPVSDPLAGGNRDVMVPTESHPHATEHDTAQEAIP